MPVVLNDLIHSLLVAFIWGCSRANAPRLILDACVPIFKMFHPSPNTARTHAHTSITTLKSLVNFCSSDFLFNEKFDDSTLAKQHIIVGHFVRNTGHVMQATDVTRHSRITQQLVPSTTILSFVCCSQFACKKWLLMTFGTTLICLIKQSNLTFTYSNYIMQGVWLMFWTVCTALVISVCMNCSKTGSSDSISF